MLRETKRKTRLIGSAVVLALALGALAIDRATDVAPAPADAHVAEGAAAQVAGGAPAAPRRSAAAEGTPDAVADPDRELLRAKLEFAREQQLDTLPPGDAIARLGRTFVGTEYVPHTLEVPGPERLVVNLRELDCVTFVENTLAIARITRVGGADFDAFRDELRGIRYRGGEIDGYASRLHYFSEWIADNEREGRVRDITRELGGVADRSRIDFMSTHPEAYRQLSDPVQLDTIRGVETQLNERVRYYIPESRIAEVAPRIRDGDIIAATSTVDGLDVAHTGIAIWVDGELHLMHAPLVGKAVEISVEPLAQRIRRIEGQDGIMVARPL